MSRNKKRTPLPFIYYCPCCDYRTLAERGVKTVCPVCFWEDDGRDFEHLDEKSSANDNLTLLKARANFQQIGACSERWLHKVCSPDERGSYEYESQEQQVQLRRLVPFLEGRGIAVAREDSLCPQCEHLAGKGAHRHSSHSDGFVVYSPEKHFGLPGKLWSSCPPATADKFNQLIIATAADAGVDLNVGPSTRDV